MLGRDIHLTLIHNTGLRYETQNNYKYNSNDFSKKKIVAKYIIF